MNSQTYLASPTRQLPRPGRYQAFQRQAPQKKLKQFRQPPLQQRMCLIHERNLKMLESRDSSSLQKFLYNQIIVTLMYIQTEYHQFPKGCIKIPQTVVVDIHGAYNLHHVTYCSGVPSTAMGLAGPGGRPGLLELT